MLPKQNEYGLEFELVIDGTVTLMTVDDFADLVWLFGCKWIYDFPVKELTGVKIATCKVSDSLVRITIVKGVELIWNYIQAHPEVTVTERIRYALEAGSKLVRQEPVK
jgi:hypothetical protein